MDDYYVYAFICTKVIGSKETIGFRLFNGTKEQCEDFVDRVECETAGRFTIKALIDGATFKCTSYEMTLRINRDYSDRED